MRATSSTPSGGSSHARGVELVGPRLLEDGEAAGDDERDALALLELLRRASARRSKARSATQRESGTSLWLGSVSGPQRSAALHRRLVEDALQRGVRVAAEAQLVVEAAQVEVDDGEDRDEGDRQRRPATIQTVAQRPRLEQRPARHRHGGEDEHARARRPRGSARSRYSPATPMATNVTMPDASSDRRPRRPARRDHERQQQPGHARQHHRHLDDRRRGSRGSRPGSR